MADRVLITGGAGFIGSHLADELLACGYRVRALDNLDPQVHGSDRRRPAYLHPDVELVVGDVRDADVVRRALDGVDAVYHFAAAVGVGQSMYEVARYTAINNLGTAVLLEALIAQPVRRLIVASSMSIYGEGLYRTAAGELAIAADREREQLERGDWEVRDADGHVLEPVPTAEWKAPTLASVYALSKYDQERMCLMIARAYGIPAVALRFFNVYGTRQALSNPYTGVLAIFASRLLNDRPPSIFEDGLQRRDFVSVTDVAQACRLALEIEGAASQVFNVGSGRSFTVREIAESLARVVGKPHIEPEITGKHRVGDIRHCFADVSHARSVLGFAPSVEFEDGLAELAQWLEGQVADDRVSVASAELATRGLTVDAQARAAVGSNGRARAASSGHERAAANGHERVAVNGRDGAPHIEAPRIERVVTREPDRELPRRVAREPEAARGRVLITGGAGFIGCNVAHRLLGEGREVTIVDNLSRPGVRRNIDWLRAAHGSRVALSVNDVRDRAALRDAVRSAAQVYHFAAQVAVTTSLVDPMTDFETNVRGTLNVLEEIRACPEPPSLLFTSTNKVYGGLDDLRLRRAGGHYEPRDRAVRATGIGEDRPLDFHSPYGCSKGAADQYVRDYARSFGLRTVVFRMSCIYGPHQFGTEDQGWVAHFLIKALAGEPITLYGDGMQVRDILFVDDLVDAMTTAQRDIDGLSGQAFNIGGGVEHTTSLLELLDLIGELRGDRPAVDFEQWRVGDQRYYVSDTSRFREATGWVPKVGVEEGVRRLHEWLEEARQSMRPERPVAVPVTRRAPARDGTRAPAHGAAPADLLVDDVTIAQESIA